MTVLGSVLKVQAVVVDLQEVRFALTCQDGLIRLPAGWGCGDVLQASVHLGHDLREADRGLEPAATGNGNMTGDAALP